MRKHSGEFRSRRELFAGTLRYAALGLMAIASAGLYQKRQRLVREGKCTNMGICDGCKIFGDCSLPPAVSAREALTGVSNGKK